MVWTGSFPERNHIASDPSQTPPILKQGKAECATCSVDPHNENALSADTCRQRIQQVSFSYARDALNMHYQRLIS